MKLESLPFKSFLIWEILSILLLTILTTLLFIIFRPYTFVWYTLLWTIGALAIFLCIFYCPLLYLSYKFCITDKHFILKRGVLFNKTHIIRKEQISFISITKDPLTPIINISTLIIVAPRSKLFIPFMNHQTNIKIMKTLSNNNFDFI